MKKSFRFTLAASSLVILMGGCAGGGYGGGTYPYGGAPYGGSSYPYGAPAGVGTAAGGAYGGVQNAIINAIIQSMAASVLNGQIGSQIAPADSNFRLQQLGNSLQSGSFTQTQQWTNPQTGNAISLTPQGQQLADPVSGQLCRNLEEVYTLQDGRTIRESRRACQDQTGKWILVQ